MFHVAMVRCAMLWCGLLWYVVLCGVLACRHVVTNWHVVNQRAQITVSFADHTTHPCTLVGADPETDVAVLKLTSPPANLSPVTLGSSKNVRVGQKAFCIGNPRGLNHTFSQGIVSALDRELVGPSGRPIRNMIQTDAAMNPGNSGGPLLSSNRRVIGMNEMIFTSSGGSEGVGFAIPIDTVKVVVDQIIKHG